MPEEMKCTEKGCEGELDLNNAITLQTGCTSRTPAYPCKICGRLYFGDDNAVATRSEPPQKVFLIDGELVRKD